MNQRLFVEIEILKSVEIQEQKHEFPIRLLLPRGLPFTLAHEALAEIPVILNDMERVEQEHVKKFLEQQDEQAETQLIEPEIV